MTLFALINLSRFLHVEQDIQDANFLVDICTYSTRTTDYQYIFETQLQDQMKIIRGDFFAIMIGDVITWV